jgi:hypothetical protein
MRDVFRVEAVQKDGETESAAVVSLDQVGEIRDG